MEAKQSNRSSCAQHWIGGQWVDSGTRRDSVNPGTGKAFGTYLDGGVNEAKSAVGAALAAFRDTEWKADSTRRATALSHLADAYERRAEELATLISTEIGKIKAEARFEVALIPRTLRFAAGLAMQTYGRVMEARPGYQAMILREPIGVAGLIVPWNAPAYLAIRALAPALAAGTTTVVKLPSQAAQVAALSSEIIASVPEITVGAVNIFVESGAEGAKFLVSSPDVPAISFTGSSAVGREIGIAAAANFKRVGLELGGKSPHLVFDDANLESALPRIEKSITVFGGQFCLTAGRLLVQRGIADAVRNGLAARLAKVKTGSAFDPANDMGSLIDQASVRRVNAMVEEAIRAGARVIVRGGPITEGALSCGAFYRPTLLEVSDPNLVIVRSEVFGAVQVMQVFDTEEQAIALANDSDYGLGASIWSENVDRPIRVARRLDVGMVFINDWASVAAQFEVGGVKHSGRGRLGGLASLDDFLEYKQITQTFRQPLS